jgi:hypothetical protein
MRQIAMPLLTFDPCASCPCPRCRPIGSGKLSPCAGATSGRHLQPQAAQHAGSEEQRHGPVRQQRRARRGPAVGAACGCGAGRARLVWQRATATAAAGARGAQPHAGEGLRSGGQQGWVEAWAGER